MAILQSKLKFHHCKNLIWLQNVDIDNILISNIVWRKQL